jgi:hypothetical protein
MYDNRDLSTPAHIRKLEPLSLDDVILYKLQSKGPMDVKARILDETSSGNQNIKSVKIANKLMFANYAELLNTNTNTKKAGTTPSKPRVSESPASHKANLKSIINLKTNKAGRRKAASSRKAETPTKRTKTNGTTGKRLANIDEEDPDEEMLDLSPLTGHGKNGYKATREQLANSDEEDSEDELLYSSLLTGYGKNGYEATREQLEDAIN